MFKLLLISGLTVMFSCVPAFAGDALSAGISYETRVKEALQREFEAETPDARKITVLREMVKRLAVNQDKEYDRAAVKSALYCTNTKEFVRQWKGEKIKNPKTASEQLKLETTNRQWTYYAIIADC